MTHTSLLSAVLLAATGVLAPIQPSAAGADVTIDVHRLRVPAAFDGTGEAWAGIPATTVALRPARPGSFESVPEVRVKAAIEADTFCLYIEWDDDTPDDVHKLWHWDEAAGKYVAGDEGQGRERSAIRGAVPDAGRAVYSLPDTRARAMSPAVAVWEVDVGTHPAMRPSHAEPGRQAAGHGVRSRQPAPPRSRKPVVREPPPAR